jgi:hypothetical protein
LRAAFGHWYLGKIDNRRIGDMFNKAFYLTLTSKVAAINAL